LNLVSKGHDPEEFIWILQQFNAGQVDPIVVAGQAVNIWGKAFRKWDAEHNPQSPKIEELQPLTSNDMELLEFKGVSALDKFEGVVHSEKTDPFGKAAAPDTATYFFKQKKTVLKVQVLAWMPGASRDELQNYLVPIQLGQEKVRIRVPDPIVLLGCKIANLATLNQKKPERNDYKHVRILMCCVRALLGQLLQNDKPPRDILKLIKRLDAKIESSDAKKIATQYQIDWNDSIPFERIDSAAKKHLPWRNFLLNRHRKSPVKSPVNGKKK